MNAGDLARAKRAAQTTMDRPLCSPAAGTSGHNELRQYEHFVRHLHGHDNRSMLARERNTENTRRPSCLYTIGDRREPPGVGALSSMHSRREPPGLLSLV